jgi:hypothetical protein
VDSHLRVDHIRCVGHMLVMSSFEGHVEVFLALYAGISGAHQLCTPEWKG